MDSIMTNGPGTMSLDVGLVYLPETNSGFEKKIIFTLFNIWRLAPYTLSLLHIFLKLYNTEVLRALCICTSLATPFLVLFSLAWERVVCTILLD